MLYIFGGLDYRKKALHIFSVLALHLFYSGHASPSSEVEFVDLFAVAQLFFFFNSVKNHKVY
jgi:hypothetical protein